MDGVDLNVTLTSVDTVSISWEPPAVHKDDADVSYIVYYKSEGSAIWNEVHTKQTSLEIDELKEGVSYVFKVAAENEAGLGFSTATTEPLKMSGRWAERRARPPPCCSGGEAEHHQAHSGHHGVSEAGVASRVPRAGRAGAGVHLDQGRRRSHARQRQHPGR